MKISENKVVFTVIAIFTGILFAVPFMIIALSKPHAIEAKPIDLAPWKSLGAVSTGFYTGTVMRRQDPDTNATIYIMIGKDGGGIFVLPAVSK